MGWYCYHHRKDMLWSTTALRWFCPDCMAEMRVTTATGTDT